MCKKNFSLFLLIVFGCFLQNGLADNLLSSTEVISYKPILPAGKVRFGACWTGAVSIVRDDAWRCAIDDQIFDPCFLTGKNNTLVCDANPSQNKPGFALRITKALPKVEKVSVPVVNAWMFQLADGEVCQPYQGVKPFFPEKDNLVLSHGCSGSAKWVGSNSVKQVGLIEDTIKPGKLWMAKRMTYSQINGEIKILKVEEVKIKKVWQ